MAMQSLPACPGDPPQGVAFDIAHAPFHLAFRPGPVGATGPGFHAPVAAEGFELGVKDRAVSLPTTPQQPKDPLNLACTLSEH